MKNTELTNDAVEIIYIDHKPLYIKHLKWASTTSHVV